MCVNNSRASILTILQDIEDTGLQIPLFWRRPREQSVPEQVRKRPHPGQQTASACFSSNREPINTYLVYVEAGSLYKERKLANHRSDTPR